MRNLSHCIDGAALAAIVSAGVGCAVLGLATVLAVASEPIKHWLDWWAPTGPLSGKSGMAVVAWVTSWILLHLKWRNRELPSFTRLWRWTLFLIFIGFLGTFPPFFELFAAH